MYYYYWILFLLLTCAVFKLFRERRRMGCVILIYIIILAIDLIVGSAIIAWKCKVLTVQEECDLAIGGTIGSLILWLILLLIMPTCVIRVDLYEQRKWLKASFRNVYTKLVPVKSSHLHSNIHTALMNQSTPLLVEEKNALILEGNMHPIIKVQDRISPVYIPILPEKDVALSTDSRVPHIR